MGCVERLKWPSSTRSTKAGSTPVDGVRGRCLGAVGVSVDPGQARCQGSPVAQEIRAVLVDDIEGTKVTGRGATFRFALDGATSDRPGDKRPPRSLTSSSSTAATLDVSVRRHVGRRSKGQPARTRRQP